MEAACFIVWVFCLFVFLLCVVVLMSNVTYEPWVQIYCNNKELNKAAAGYSAVSV